MALLRNGHSRVYEYGYSLFITARDELMEDEQRQIVNRSYSHRMSRVNDEAWKQFVSASEKKQTHPEKKKKKQMSKDDHLKVIRALKGH